MRTLRLGALKRQRKGSARWRNVSSNPGNPNPADPARLVEHAINNLSLGLVIFDSRREVVFCNQRYAELYGFTSEQIKPGTPLGELIRHR